MRRLAILLALTVSPAAAQSPARAPNYDAMKAHIAGHTPAQLATQMFGATPPADYTRAGGAWPHLGLSGVVMLWSRPQVLGLAAPGPPMIVCQLHAAQANLQSLEPPTFRDAADHLTYKTLLAPPDDPTGARAAQACADIDPRTYDTAPDAATDRFVTAALYGAMIHPKEANLLGPARCTYPTGPICETKPSTLPLPYMSIETGACGGYVARRFPSASPAAFGSGRCHFAINYGAVGFQVVLEDHGDRPGLLFEQTMTMGYSQSYLADPHPTN